MSAWPDLALVSFDSPFHLFNYSNREYVSLLLLVGFMWWSWTTPLLWHPTKSWINYNVKLFWTDNSVQVTQIKSAGIKLLSNSKCLLLGWQVGRTPVMEHNKIYPEKETWLLSSLLLLSSLFAGEQMPQQRTVGEWSSKAILINDRSRSANTHVAITLIGRHQCTLPSPFGSGMLIKCCGTVAARRLALSA